MTQIESILSNLGQELERHVATLSSILPIIGKHTKQLDELTQKMSQVDEIVPIKNKANDIQGKIDQACKDQSVSNELYKNEIVALKQAITQRIYETKAIKDQFDAFTSSSKEQSIGDNREFSNALAAIKATVNTLKNEVYAKFEQMQKDLVVSPKDILDQNATVMKKLDSVQIDGSNAMLKASNVDASLKIMEKKLENLTLQMKKLDLTNQ